MVKYRISFKYPDLDWPGHLDYFSGVFDTKDEAYEWAAHLGAWASTIKISVIKK